jgi:uncharacterized membrane protein
MKTFKLLLTLLFGVLLIFAGINHFLKPEMYAPFIPDFMPGVLVNYLVGILEVVLGLGVLIPRFRYHAALGILLLMLAFLPLHVWDVFREHPAIGSHQVALIRLPLQFILIAWAWFISRR